MIELATLEDIDAIHQIEQLSFGDRAFSRMLFRNYIKKEQMYVFKRFVFDEVAGYIVVFTNKRTARVHVVAVHPKWTGWGYGSALMYHVEQIYKPKCDKIYLEVNEQNTRAIQLYERLGYKQVKKLPNFYGLGTTGIKMLKLFS